MTTTINRQNDPMDVWPTVQRAITASEQYKLIGMPGTINQGGLNVHIRITDVKKSYGNVRYLVTPVSGTGSVWVDAGRVSFENSQEKSDGQ